MKIVIDIPKEDYKRIKSEVQKFGGSYRDWEEEIANGTPLPENHGRLIDLNDLYDFDRRKVEYAPTIIEAESEE